MGTVFGASNASTCIHSGGFLTISTFGCLSHPSKNSELLKLEFRLHIIALTFV